MYSIIKPLLFQLDPETAHHLTLKCLQLLHRYHCGFLLKDKHNHANNTLAESNSSSTTTLMGLTLPNPVGLAAGLDKNGEYIDALAMLGFGFIEVGTVTPLPQAGNPKPRLFRLPAQQAIINRMGFNNYGIDTLINNIANSQYRGILGINIGKNAATPLEKAADDYLICLEKAYPYANYITINISSPNTRNLRSLQSASELDRLLNHLKNRQAQLATQQSRYVPIAIKIAPDLDEEQITAIADVALNTQIDGIIATNTTIDKTVLGNHKFAQEVGGLSGLPVQTQSNHVLRQLSALLDSQIPLIGVGGITSGADAADKIRLGATALQLYSGLIFRGPQLIKECINACGQLK
ncbi:quinone-dependent dihydroorotate dehydrogenase [Snodgrassella gandavensis]|uniref:quinone-dependent dihydroorotate dehydrogenase n=1 Tax=Snodgrassella gandavensis TaxID=2946698 RepID=UPI001EF706CD|nr:quinone-dependent dihydroorotate dehydrogenase [Snodgrassella gandavensis]